MSQSIVEKLNQTKLYYSQQDVANTVSKETKDQLDREAQLIKSGSYVSRVNATYGSEGIASLNEASVVSSVKNKYYDPNVMTATSRILETIFYGVPYSDVSVQNLLIRRWIKNAKKIGVESAFGDVFLTQFGTSQGAFVVKTSKSPDDKGLVHELFVGLYGTNQLRTELPNFAYVFGGFDCSPAFFSSKTEPASVCSINDSNKFVKYVVYENIMPSESMSEYCGRCSSDEFYAKYLQILLALNRANQICDYTNYDLHSQNVLIRTVNTKRLSLPYIFEGEKLYINDDAIATIIDNGRAHIKVNGTNYGYRGAYSYGVDPNKSNPIHDAYKLLCWSLFDMKAKNNTKTFNEVSKLLKYFNQTESALQILQAQQRTTFSLPLDVTGGVVEFIKWIRVNYKPKCLTTNIEMNRQVYGCNTKLGGQDKCQDLGYHLDQFSVARSELNSPVDFFLLDREFSSRPVQLEQLRRTYQDKAKAQLIKYVNQDYTMAKIKYEKALGLINGKLNASIVEGRKNSFVGKVAVDQYKVYRSYVERYAQIIEGRQDFEFTTAVIKYVSKIYGLIDIYNEVVLTEQKINTSASNFLMVAADSLKQDIQYFRQLITTNFNDIKESLNKQPELSWYFESLPKYDYLI